VGPPAVAVKAILDLSKEASEGLVGFVDSVPGMNEANRKFVEAYKKEYNGAEPDRQAPWSYDAVYLFANAIKKNGEDRAKIREALLARKASRGSSESTASPRRAKGSWGAYRSDQERPAPACQDGHRGPIDIRRGAMGLHTAPQADTSERKRREVGYWFCCLVGSAS